MDIDLKWSIIIVITCALSDIDITHPLWKTRLTCIPWISSELAWYQLDMWEKILCHVGQSGFVANHVTSHYYQHAPQIMFWYDLCCFGFVSHVTLLSSQWFLISDSDPVTFSPPMVGPLKEQPAHLWRPSQGPLQHVQIQIATGKGGLRDRAVAVEDQQIRRGSLLHQCGGRVDLGTLWTCSLVSYHCLVVTPIEKLIG